MTSLELGMDNKLHIYVILMTYFWLDRLPGFCGYRQSTAPQIFTTGRPVYQDDSVDTNKSEQWLAPMGTSNDTSGRPVYQGNNTAQTSYDI